MSIIFPDHVTAYYIPNTLEFYNAFKNCNSEYSLLSTTNSTSIPDCDENPVKGRQRIFELKYETEGITPSASTQKLEPFVTTQKVDTHPIKDVEERTWCIIECKYPPEEDLESMYVAALDYAFLEEYDAVIIEPFQISQRTEQWINIMSAAWTIFGAYLSVAAAAALTARINDPSTTFVGVFSVCLLKLYKKYVMGDPISKYRNIDLGSNEDMDFVYHMSDLMDMHGPFGHVVFKDVRRERLRYNILRGLIGLQIGLSSYKYFFGIFLKYAFSDLKPNSLKL